MFNNIEQLELQLEISELWALGLTDEEIQGYFELYWVWEFKEKEDYDIQ